jgi:hypothetical protein
MLNKVDLEQNESFRLNQFILTNVHKNDIQFKIVIRFLLTAAYKGYENLTDSILLFFVVEKIILNYKSDTLKYYVSFVSYFVGQ